MIKASGNKYGKKMVVSWSKENGFLFDEEKNMFLEKIVDYELSERHPIGGLFFPKKYDVRNIINVFQYYFFDGIANVEVDEEIEPIEHEEGRVY